MDAILKPLEEAALAGIEDYMSYRELEEDNAFAFKKCKYGVAVIGTYARALATQANMRALNLQAQRQEALASGGVVSDDPAVLAPGGATTSGDLDADGA